MHQVSPYAVRHWLYGVKDITLGKNALAVRERDVALVSALKKVRDEHPAYGVRGMIEALPDMLKPSYGKGYSICCEYGLLQKRLKPHGITKTNPKAQSAEDLVKGDFKSEAPNTKWLTDITEMKCKDGKLYLCGHIGLF